MLTVKGVLENCVLTTDDGQVLEVWGLYCGKALHGYFQLDTDEFGHLRVVRRVLISL